MSDEYTPTAGQVREAYADQTGVASRRQMHRDDFDRWLAEHDREVTARALRAAADAMGDLLECSGDTRWDGRLRDRADAVEAGAA